MKQAPLPIILFPPKLCDRNDRELLQWLQTLLHAIDSYYADQWSQPDPRQTQLNLWPDDDLPF